MRTNTTKDEDGWIFEEYCDDSGRTVKKVDKNPQGEITMVIEYEYDAGGKCSRWTVSNQSGQTIKKFEIKRNEKGPPQLLQFDSSGNLEKVADWDE